MPGEGSAGLDREGGSWEHVFAPCHTSRRTQSWLWEIFCNDITSNIWLPHSPNCNPLDYYVCGGGWLNNTKDELKARITAAFGNLETVRVTCRRFLSLQENERKTSKKMNDYENDSLPISSSLCYIALESVLDIVSIWNYFCYIQGQHSPHFIFTLNINIFCYLQRQYQSPELIL